jgi:Na+/H+-dicarboxylate symporter
MKSIRIGLLPRIFIAILLGIILGQILPEELSRIFFTFNSLFSEFLDFVIPLIILALVAEAIASIGKGAGIILMLTVALAYGSTVFSGYLAYFTGSTFFPSLIDARGLQALSDNVSSLSPYFSINVPPVMGVMTALVLAFIIGLGASRLETTVLKRAIEELKEIISKLIANVIIPVLPLYIYGIFLDMSYSGKVFGVLMVFVKIISIIFILHIGLLLFQFVVAGLVAKRNPLRLLANMLPAYFMALGTSSSAATIPVTLAQVKRNGVSDDVASFVVPLCATIHLSGSMLKIVSCALALILMSGGIYDVSLFTEFILILAITMVAAPGVPGGAIMAALAVLQSVLGFNEEQLALMVSLYIAMDSFGTACNVTGDGAIAVIVNRLQGKKSKES